VFIFRVRSTATDEHDTEISECGQEQVAGGISAEVDCLHGDVINRYIQIIQYIRKQVLRFFGKKNGFYRVNGLKTGPGPKGTLFHIQNNYVFTTDFFKWQAAGRG